MKLKINDAVAILAGKDLGKTGKVAQVLKKSNKVIISGLNLLKKLKLEILEIPKRKNLQNTISLVIGVYQNEMNTMINYTSQR